MNDKVKHWLGNGGAEWLWKTAPIIFAAGVVFAQLRGVQHSIEGLEARVASVEQVLMKN